MPKATLKRKDERGGPGALAVALVVASALLTAGLFGFLVHQAVTSSEGTRPEVAVASTERLPGGGLVVTVSVANHADGGFRQVVVSVDCGETPPEVTFENVPAEGRREAEVMCPPGTPGPPDATLVTWERA